MLSLVISSLKRQIINNKSVVVMLLVGLIISFLCISVMSGLAVGQYRMHTGYNTYATLTIDPGSYTKENVQLITDFVLDLSNDGISNMLLLSPYEENLFLVGWYGTSGNKWFPITTGRFFTRGEQEEATRVAFISDSLQKEYADQTQINIGTATYDIIGNGWIAPNNFNAAISGKSGVQLFLPDSTSQNTYFAIIPYRCYIKEFKPSLIMVHFNAATYNELETYASKIAAKFPDSSTHLPMKNSDDVRSQSQLQYGVVGIMLCIIAGITVLQLMAEWIDSYRSEIYVYRLSGMKKVQCLCLVYGHWLVYFVLGTIVAVTLHYCAFPLLQIVHANYLPDTSVLCVSLLALYLASCLYSYKRISGVMALSKKEKAI